MIKLLSSVMFSFNLTKFFALFTLILLLFSGCGLWSKTNNANSSQAPPVSDDLKSEIPFASKEPDQFQAEIVVTANETERKTFIARNGTNRRYDFNPGAKNQVINLQTDKNYLVLPDKKIYAENNAVQTASTDDWADFLTTEWLNEKTDATFEKLERSENLTKYRVRLGGGSSSEIFIYVDENLNLPVKQEFYTASGEQKTLTYSFELKDLKLQTDENLFAVPSDYRQVSIEELRKTLQSSQE